VPPPWAIACGVDDYVSDEGIGYRADFVEETFVSTSYKSPTPSELDRFFSSATVGMLIASARENSALKIAFPKELQISRMFAWLFRSNEGHGLGDLALKTLLLKAWGVADAAGNARLIPIRPTDAHQVSFANAVVLQEYVPSGSTESKNRLDIVIVDQSNKLLIGIENKYGARQGPEQLKRYADALTEEVADKRGWKVALILLDDDEHSKPHDERWVKLDYSWLKELVYAQLNADLLSEESASTLWQFVGYLDAADGAPYPRLAETDISAAIIKLAHDHPKVMSAMGALSNLNVASSMSELLSSSMGPLALEYIRHRQLWDHVLTVGAKADLLSPLNDQFDDVESDLSSSCRSYFSRKRWRQDWRYDKAPVNEAYWPIYVMLYESQRANKPVIRVAADFYPGHLREAHRDSYRARALALRKVNKLSQKGLRDDAERIRMFEQEFASLAKAKQVFIEAFSQVDAHFDALIHRP
jgi:hypothetical protein